MTTIPARVRDWFERHFTFTLVLGGLTLGLTIVTAILALVVFPRVDEAEDNARDARARQAATDEALRRVTANNVEVCGFLETVDVELEGIRRARTTSPGGAEITESLGAIGEAAGRAVNSPACPDLHSPRPGVG